MPSSRVHAARYILKSGIDSFSTVFFATIAAILSILLRRYSYIQSSSYLMSHIAFLKQRLPQTVPTLRCSARPLPIYMRSAGIRASRGEYEKRSAYREVAISMMDRRDGAEERRITPRGLAFAAALLIASTPAPLRACHVVCCFCL